jgi:hypothetical protein
MITTQKQGGKEKELIQTDPMILWNGWSGPVEIAGMRFRVTKKTMGDGREVKIVHVFAAPRDTELHGLGGLDVYVTVAQLHFQDFRSRLREGSSKWLEQKRIWEFLHGVFVAVGIKTVHRDKPSVSSKLARDQHQRQEVKTSASIEDFILGTPGAYCFDKHSSQAVFRVKLTASQFGTARQMPVVELMSVDLGHPLCIYCRSGTFLYHDTLARERTPDFKGARAGDLQKMWEFLTDMIAEHRGTSVATSVRCPNTPPSTTVNYHGNA